MKTKNQVLFAMLIVAGSHVSAQTYKVNVSVESAGKTIGQWSQMTQAQQLTKNVEPAILSLVSPTQMLIDNKPYNAGFNIKFNISQAPNTNGSYTNYLTLASSYTTTQTILLSNEKLDKDPSTLAPGKLIQSNFKNEANPVVLNTIRFTKVYDITQPRNIAVPIAHFVLDEGDKKSLVTLKLQVEKVK